MSFDICFVKGTWTSLLWWWRRWRVPTWAGWGWSSCLSPSRMWAEITFAKCKTFSPDSNQESEKLPDRCKYLSFFVLILCLNHPIIRFLESQIWFYSILTHTLPGRIYQYPIFIVKITVNITFTVYKYCYTQVQDSVDYLESLGRTQTAAVHM